MKKIILILSILLCTPYAAWSDYKFSLGYGLTTVNFDEARETTTRRDLFNFSVTKGEPYSFFFGLDISFKRFEIHTSERDFYLRSYNYSFIAGYEFELVEKWSMITMVKLGYAPYKVNTPTSDPNTQSGKAFSSGFETLISYEVDQYTHNENIIIPSVFAGIEVYNLHEGDINYSGVTVESSEYNLILIPKIGVSVSY